MRFVAIDLGDKRTGVAAGDAVTRTASPVGVLEIPIDRADGRDLLRAIDRAAAEHLARPAAAPTRSDSEALGRAPWASVIEPSEADDAFAARGGIILGLPINMDGSEGSRAALVRAWAARIAQATGHRVRLVDERLSSAQADQWMARTGLTHKQKKARRDALAAAAILQRFLLGLPGGLGGRSPDDAGDSDSSIEA